MIKETKKKAIKFLAKHFVEGTALLTSTNPIYSFMETIVSRMSNSVSIGVRENIALMTYLGLASVYTKARDFSKSHFGITQNSEDKVQKTHDRIFTAGFNVALSVPLYVFNGEHDPWKVAAGTTLAGALGLGLGGYIGKAVDGFNDLMGIESSVRLPEKIRNLKPIVKKGLAGLLVAGSLFAMEGVYKVNPFDNGQNRQEIVQNSYLNK